MASSGGAEQPGGLEEYLGQEVVIDTQSSYIIIGTLKGIDRDYLTIEDADIHDTNYAESTKDQYIMEAARLGLCPNRSGAKVRASVIISISLLKDIKVV